jgi:serine/threonine protein kinase
MAIQVGQCLGPYEILSAIGAGGMGEVYRAKDTRLDRIIAIKVLPDHLSSRAELRERFEREAHTIASLNHPHICTLYDIGHQDGTDFLVLEYLEGETLAERLKKGPLPIAQVLRYAIEISDALDKAHRKGVTHRDLKPSNIMLTRSGTKLLDFGLAKLQQEETPGSLLSRMSTAGDELTAQGTIIGTLQYMAPEQLEGKGADARTDIFAFGLMVYEMATGKKAFEGKSQASLIAKILETEPAPISLLQPMTPPALDHLVRRCLAKDPDERWQSARDVSEQLKWISETRSQAAVAVASVSRSPERRRTGLAWVAATAALVIAAIAASALYLRRTPSPETHAIRFTVGPPENGSFFPAPNFLTISPDGTKLAFVAAEASSGKQQLWVRGLDSATAQPLPGTENPTQPFWSADSRFLGFNADGKLKKIAVSGGPALTLAEKPPSGGTWNGEDVILFGGGAIYRVSAAGGAATPVTTLDTSRGEVAHFWPYFLPDGKHFLYLAYCSNPEKNAIFVGSLGSKDRKLLLNATSNPVYVPPGYLLFDRQGTLMAEPFDAVRLELTGEAVPIAEGVQFNATGGRTAFAASNNSVLAYRGGEQASALTMVWVSRNGTEQRLAAPPHSYTMPRVSPDGRRVAAGIEEADSQIWLYDLGRETLTRLTFDGTGNIDPIWTPDSKRIVFKGKGQRLFWQPADGSGPAEELTRSELSTDNVPGSFSPDGQVLTFMELSPGFEIFTLPLADGKPQPFIRSPSNGTAPRFSADGHFIAYASNESGRSEIYVRPYPGPGGKWQISTDGGGEPVWNPKGRELFYRSGNKMMAVDVTTQETFSAGNPKMLFEGLYVPTPRSFQDYDVSPDGQRFLMLKAAGQGQVSPQINVVVNWTEELKQVPPGNK